MSVDECEMGGAGDGEAEDEELQVLVAGLGGSDLPEAGWMESFKLLF